MTKASEDKLRYCPHAVKLRGLVNVYNRNPKRGYLWLITVKVRKSDLNVY